MKINLNQYKLPWLEKHAIDVAELTFEFCKYINYNNPYIFAAGYYHDIGKNLIPQKLLESTEISSEDFEIIKKHPLTGQEIAQKLNLPSIIQISILEHHENYDGTGYPYQKSYSDIHYLPRIIRITDSFCAMTENRNYNHAMTKDEALNEIARNASKLYDPFIVSAFINYQSITKIPFEKHFQEKPS